MFDKVLKFAAARASRRVWAIKGASGFARPAFKASAALKGRASQRLYIVGVDSIKSLLFQRLKRGQSVRFSNTLDGSYFEQLASERLVTRYLRGRPERRFERVVGRRAETLDALVYCHAAREGCAKSRRARGRIEARSAKHGAGKGHTIKMVGWHLAQLTQDGAAASAWRLCGEVTFMKFAVGIIGAIFAVISGFCWLKAARIKVPTLGAVYGGPPRMIVESANNQAWWNSRAAWFASGAAFAQALTILI